ncbi:MAG: GntR family transcriptional regulator [Synergistaceae bacterium]|jgi:DNA-binding GntR family transcriptional regulator|nr:GntR family transcriptional regulator [Synergistaceae bacterium]
MSKIKSTKKQYAYNEIKKLIQNGDLVSGEIYSEQMLADMLSGGTAEEVSRTPVREALQAMALEGAVRIKPKKGVLIVSHVSVNEVADMFDLRAAIETYIVRKAIPRLKFEDIAVLRGYIEKQKIYTANENRSDFVKLDFKMHMYLMEVYRNEWMSDIISRLRERFFSVGVHAVIATGRPCEELLAEHIEYVDALERRNLPLAIDCLLRHFEKGVDSYKEYMNLK